MGYDNLTRMQGGLCTDEDFLREGDLNAMAMGFCSYVCWKANEI